MSQSENEEENDNSFWRNRKDKKLHEKGRGIMRKYIPKQKTYEELVNSDMQVQNGATVDSLDGRILVSGGDGHGFYTSISSFDECDFSQQIRRNLTTRAYKKPTPMQSYVIPLIIKTTYDIIGCSPTGSGKSASFILPILKQLQDEFLKGKSSDNSLGLNIDSPKAIVLAPTKELVLQIKDDSVFFAQGTGITVAYAIGDVPMDESLKILRKGCNVLVSTLGRIKHYIRDSYIRLDKLEFLVMDEADKILLGQEDYQLVKHIKSLATTNKRHRTLLFSATMNQLPPSLFEEFLKPNYFKVDGGNLVVRTIKQEFIKISAYDKRSYLFKLLKDQSRDSNGYLRLKGRAMIFVKERRRADWLAICLCQENFRAMSINSQRTLEQRQEAVDDFSKGTYDILVGTDVVGRGLNFPKVMLVINFDLPMENNMMPYTHRIGRTGRIGNQGSAISFVDLENGNDIELIPFLADQLISCDQEVPEWMKEIVNNRNIIMDSLDAGDAPSITTTHRQENAAIDSDTENLPASENEINSEQDNWGWSWAEESEGIAIANNEFLGDPF